MLINRLLQCNLYRRYHAFLYSHLALQKKCCIFDAHNQKVLVCIDCKVIAINLQDKY
jgi:hypothetical protein